MSVEEYNRTLSLSYEEMETNLDALLADLQSHVSTTNSTPEREQFSDHSRGNDAHIYQNGNHVMQHNGTLSTHDSHQPKMYKHETREEIRTETHSSGPTITTSRPAISNNISELDTLVQDLNTYKKTGVFNDNSVVNDTRPSLNSLLRELNNVDKSEKVERHTTTTYKPAVPPPVRTSHVSASNATRELDDLMASLSDFKKEEALREAKTDSLKRSSNVYSSYNNLADPDAPPRPPAPCDTDVLAVPPKRPPLPSNPNFSEEQVTLPTALPAPRTPSPPPPAVLNVMHRKTEVTDADDPMVIPLYGGPVKRNDSEYRWVTDQNKPEIRAMIDEPFEEPKFVEQPKQEILRSPPLVRKLIHVDYAKPKPKPKTPSPSPSPEPPQVNLDSMLGSLKSHMTEQGVTTTPKGSCTACDKPIVGSVITALGKPWHPEHFVCAHCQEELGTKNFYERDGKPYCERDYHELFSPKCAYCNTAILDRCATALNMTFHPEHFFCANCSNTFGEGGFHEKNGKPYCKDCYFNMFAPKCGGCNLPIMENYISALNAQWHAECFVCKDCRQPFNGGSFFDHEGWPYCETHYHAKRGSLCAGCTKPIAGRCITAMFRKWHPECFVCSFCLQQLNKGTFKEQNDKPYCHGCFDKLFG